MTETEAIRQNYELGVMAGEARERQRIAKLINYRIVICCPDFVTPIICERCLDGQELIALIKREK